MVSMRGRLKALIKEDRIIRKHATAKSRRPVHDLLNSLPTELRVMVYEHVLSCDKPIAFRQNLHSHKRCHQANRSAILRVNRQVYAEAIAVFYDANFVAVRRSVFCCTRYVNPTWPFAATQIRRLLLTDMSMSETCTARRESVLLNDLPACSACQPSLFGLLGILRTLPCLKEVEIQCKRSYIEIDNLETSLLPDCPDTDIIHSGYFRYRLAANCVDGIQVTLVDSKLALLWSNVLAFSLEPEGAITMKAILAGHPYVLGADCRALHWLLAFHDYADPPQIPTAIASTWPADLPMDLRVLPALGDSEFLREFTAALMLLLAQDHQDWHFIPRRMD
ncbi:hypothetical protein LTR36_008689 [Oleoguttula mirabilis]|uniref:Uncharacterized protein n=1 Tax=Oleoguttula mirabilis TaxID=1507867 RepID=A0AAV9JV42_9PEZI|nr:hypothetical protein LTR36_008689 [Oleoguttula mirabilis]